MANEQTGGSIAHKSNERCALIAASYAKQFGMVNEFDSEGSAVEDTCDEIAAAIRKGEQ